MKKKNAGYKLDLATQTLTLTSAFADATNDPTSDEYKLVRTLLADFPQLSIVKKTHTSPKYYKNKDGSKTKNNQFKNLTYENIEAFMAELPNSEKYLKEYNRIKASAKVMSNSAYAVVRKWFAEQFPLYKSNPLFYLDNPPEIIDFQVLLEAQKIEQKGGA